MGRRSGPETGPGSDITGLRAGSSIGCARGCRRGCGRVEVGACRCYVAQMTSFLSSIVLPIAVAAVAIVLLLGLVNMMRGGSPSRSQNLMRLRGVLQFLAIVNPMVGVWGKGKKRQKKGTPQWSFLTVSITRPGNTAPRRS